MNTFYNFTATKTDVRISDSEIKIASDPVSSTVRQTSDFHPSWSLMLFPESEGNVFFVNLESPLMHKAVGFEGQSRSMSQVLNIKKFLKVRIGRRVADEL